MVKRLATTGLLMLVLLCITSCSVKTLYNNLDYLIPEYVDGLVSLDDVLEDRLEQRTVALLSWHRHSQLPEYADWLRAVQQDLGDDLTQRQVMQRMEELNGFWRQLVKRVNREMTTLLPLLNESQRNELFASLADANEEFREQYIDLSRQQRIEAYAERLTDNYESWLGDLTRHQELAIGHAAKNLRSSAELRLQRRLKWQQEIYSILHGQTSVAAKSQRLGEFLASFEDMNSNVMKTVTDNNRKIIARLTVDMAHSMNQEQKKHFMEKTDDYIEMFMELTQRQQVMLQR